jgi:hypothetical protein
MEREIQQKPFYNSQNILLTLDDKQKQVLEEAKAELAKESIQLPDEMLAWFVLSKKKPAAVVHACSQYVHWLTALDYATMPWDYVEFLLRRQMLVPPHSSDALFGRAKDGSHILYLNSNELEPKFAGGRLLIGTLWLVVHFLLSKTQALTTKVTMCGQMCDIGWSKFYPQIQRPVFESMQTVLPVRFARMLLVDSPFVFWMIFEIIQYWLSAKFKERIIVCSSKDVATYVEKKEEIPPFIKGGKKQYDLESFMEEMKSFYEEEFKPTVCAFVVDQSPRLVDIGEDLWNPSKEFNDIIAKMKDPRKKNEKQKKSKK